jgi:multidrug efflux system membrane fusion protein
VVKAGQVLATIDPADSALSAMAAAAQLDLATADRQRFRQLREKNFVSQAALDARETSYKAAKAQAELARNQASYTVLKARPAGGDRPDRGGSRAGGRGRADGDAAGTRRHA